ncbi:MAG: endolytic transglycosylase MltG [Deltaproteobacteria bacterium]|nr:endolytic transglycosylase MltG [Deltaproteobacteria bacterium]
MVKRLFTIFAVLIVPCIALAIWFFVWLTTPILPKTPEITIEKGMSLHAIAAKLSEQKIISHPRAFVLYAQATGRGQELKAGVYLFDKAVTPQTVLDYLAKGVVYALKIRLIEGWTNLQMVNHLTTLPFIKIPNFKEEFLALTKNAAFIKSLELYTPTLEGYLSPQTYYLAPGSQTADFLTAFVMEFKKVYQEALKDLTVLPSLSEHQIVTLASIIEKETGAEEERTIIASVFYNRLDKGMLLQSDPTIIYGLKHFDGDIRKGDITHQNIYNTYVHKGLPPGPICNPGRASIYAALHPAKTDYLFFVSKGNGTHYFSKTAKEHLEAVRKYQIERTQIVQ